jgi:hypothetical protein
LFDVALDDSRAVPREQALASQWICSASWDGLWMFSGLWAPLLVALGYVAVGTFSRDARANAPFQQLPRFALAYTALSVLHRMSTTYAVLGTPILRDEIKSNPKRYLYVPLAIVVGCLVLAQAFTFHAAFSFLPSVHAQLWGFFALAYVMMLWERWHFCAQEFGVLSIYRIRAKQSAVRDKSFDRAYSVLLMLVVNMSLFICLGFQDERNVLLYGTRLESFRPWLERIALLMLVVGMLAMLTALAREWRHPQRSLPKLGFYFLIGAHTLVLYFFPDAMGLFFFTYVFHHWMVAVGLFNRVTLRSYEGSESPAAVRYAKRVLPALAVCVLWYLFFEPLDKAGNLAPVPDANMFVGASTGAKVFSGVVIGIFFAFNYLHYYYDRCFYSFANPAVRKSVGPLLFGQSAPKPLPEAAQTAITPAE